MKGEAKLDARRNYEANWPFDANPHKDTQYEKDWESGWLEAQAEADKRVAEALSDEQKSRIRGMRASYMEMFDILTEWLEEGQIDKDDVKQALEKAKKRRVQSLMRQFGIDQ